MLNNQKVPLLCSKWVTFIRCVARERSWGSRESPPPSVCMPFLLSKHLQPVAKKNDMIIWRVPSFWHSVSATRPPPLLKILATPLPFMLYYAYIKRDNISTSHLVYRSLNASLQCNSPLLWLDYYEMSFLVHVMRITRSGAAEEGWISKITIWKHNLEALFHVETTRW